MRESGSRDGQDAVGIPFWITSDGYIDARQVWRENLHARLRRTLELAMAERFRRDVPTGLNSGLFA